MKRFTRRLLEFGGVALAAATLTVIALRVAVADVPVADGMTYTGYLEDGDGAPLAQCRSLAGPPRHARSEITS